MAIQDHGPDAVLLFPYRIPVIGKDQVSKHCRHNGSTPAHREDEQSETGWVSMGSHEHVYYQNRDCLWNVSCQLTVAKVCHCESSVARDEAIYCIAKAEIAGGTGILPVIPNRQAGSLSHRLLLAMTQDQRFPA